MLRTLAGLISPTVMRKEEGKGEPDPATRVRISWFWLGEKLFGNLPIIHNANCVWPGTFNLADYLLAKKDKGAFQHEWGRVLELEVHGRLARDSACIISGQHSDDANADAICCTSIQRATWTTCPSSREFKFNYELN
jgi:hypothetical protein